MTAMYIIHEIVEHDYDFPDILDNIDIVLVPVANPGLHGNCFFSNFLKKSFLQMVTFLRTPLTGRGTKIVVQQDQAALVLI
jgi:hypothetical protein